MLFYRAKGMVYIVRLDVLRNVEMCVYLVKTTVLVFNLNSTLPRDSI
jgi:hypothetical protein